MPQRKWCVRTGRSPEASVHLVCTPTSCLRSHSTTDREGNLLLCTEGTEETKINHRKRHEEACVWYFIFCSDPPLTSTSNRVDPYPGHSLMMLMYFSMAWCWGMPCSLVHFSRTLVLVADVSSFTHISSICSSSTCSVTDGPISEEHFNRASVLSVNQTIIIQSLVPFILCSFL